MLLSHSAKINWNSRIKNHYTELGYEFTKMGDPLVVDVAHLTKGSSADVDVECDYCGKVYQKKWHKYLIENEKSLIHTDCCYDCKTKKAEASILRRYGVPNVFQVGSVKEKIKETNLEKYGCENPFSSEEIKRKIKETNLERYGFECAIRNPDVQRKSANTSLERYGVEYYVQKYHFRGDLSPKWKGGVTYHRVERATYEYRDWRRRVYSRDSYTCQCCGSKNGDSKTVYLNAHHIKNWLDYPDERYNVNNGITLCKECHMLFHSLYGKRNNNETQIKEFLLNKGKKIC